MRWKQAFSIVLYKYIYFGARLEPGKFQPQSLLFFLHSVNMYLLAKYERFVGSFTKFVSFQESHGIIFLYIRFCDLLMPPCVFAHIGILAKSNESVTRPVHQSELHSI